jgi:threonine dehydrogenase-like Zn-dependent dehydrogenase
MKTMQAAVFCGDGRVDVQRQAVPEPAANEVCVRLEGCGVCASNLPVWTGKPWFDYPLPPGSPGHEGWGEVSALGANVDGFRVGERVALLSGRAYAEYDIAKVDNIARVPRRFDGVPVPGEPLACAMNIFRRCAIEAGQWVGVVGTGFIGALLVQLASRAGAKVIALTRRPYAMQTARWCGAAHTLPCNDTAAAIGSTLELTHGVGCARVIEAAGVQSSLDVASAITAEGGRLIIAGYHQDGPRQVNMQQWNWRGIDVINAHERDPRVIARGLREAMRAVDDGRLDPFPLLTHRYSLDALSDAFEAMRTRPEGFLKATVAL